MTWEPEPYLENAKAKVEEFRKKREQVNKPEKEEEDHDEDEDEDEWEVEAIRDERQTAKGEAEFLVKWVGDDNLTWEPEPYLENGQAKVEEFCKKREQVNKPEEKEEDHDEEEEEEEEDDESDKLYQVEKILDMKVKHGQKSFLIKWKGHKKPTLESEKNVDAEMIQEFMRDRAKSAKCFFCNETDGVARYCETCGQPMHHFCCIEACPKMKIPINASNSTTVTYLQDFGDLCYCSKSCYSGKPDNKRKKSYSEEEQETLSDISKKKCKVTKVSKKQQVPPQSATKKTETKQRGKENKFFLQQVAFALKDARSWMILTKDDAKKISGLAESLYLIGVIKDHRIKKGKNDSDSSTKRKAPREYEYQVVWTATQFQGMKRWISTSQVIEGISTYNQVNLSRNLQWERSVFDRNEKIIAFDDDPDELQEYDGPLVEQFYEDCVDEINSHEEVEQIAGLRFSMEDVLSTPSDLFTREDGSTDTRIKESSRHIFLHSASSCFFAYLPKSFWEKVVQETNAYASNKNSKHGTRTFDQNNASSSDEEAESDVNRKTNKDTITMDDLMKFFGILFHMTIDRRGEMENYWGQQPEEEILGITPLRLDSIMTFARFKFIRSNLCFDFSVTPEQLKEDPAARIRVLIQTLKINSRMHVDFGRNVSVDESTVASRSKYARHLIVYNATKPTGKYHFKIYVCACATTWIAFGFKLHCSSTMEARLEGTVDKRSAKQFEKSLAYSSEVCKHVLEVTRSIFKTNRIVNTDNFYTSVKLLMSLRTVGLYGRGTVRKNSKHFPSFVMLEKDKNTKRGDMIVAVNASQKIVACSWMDGSVVNMLSNADSSGTSIVTRQLKQKKVEFKAPLVVKEYNKFMQGVDRTDQMRSSRYSIADGHSFKKWHKKLAMAFIDIARVNAYETRKLAQNDEAGEKEKQRVESRDPHRFFLLQLISDLLYGNWMNAIESDPSEILSESTPGTPTSTTRASRSSPSPSIQCRSDRSSLLIKGGKKKHRSSRNCVICKHEGRKATQRTFYCHNHKVCVCMHRYYRNDPSNPGLNLKSSQDSREYSYEWTCWDKFHAYYLPRGLFTAEGNIVRTSPMNQERKIVMQAGNLQVEYWGRDAIRNSLPAIREEPEEKEQEQEQEQEEEEEVEYL